MDIKPSSHVKSSPFAPVTDEADEMAHAWPRVDYMRAIVRRFGLIGLMCIDKHQDTS